MLPKIHYSGDNLSQLSINAEQCSFDSHIVHLRSIVSLSASSLEAPGSLQIRPSFSMDLGIIVSLYLTVLSWRYPAVRRESLSLFSRLSLPRREGVWIANDARGVDNELYSCNPEVSYLIERGHQSMIPLSRMSLN